MRQKFAHRDLHPQLAQQLQLLCPPALMDKVGQVLFYSSVLPSTAILMGLYYQGCRRLPERQNTRSHM